MLARMVWRKLLLQQSVMDFQRAKMMLFLVKKKLPKVPGVQVGVQSYLINAGAKGFLDFLLLYFLIPGTGQS